MSGRFDEGRNPRTGDAPVPDARPTERGVAFTADGTIVRHRRCPGTARAPSSPRTWPSVSGSAAVVVLGRHGDGTRRSWWAAIRGVGRVARGRARRGIRSARAATRSWPASSPPRRSRSSPPTWGRRRGVVISRLAQPPRIQRHQVLRRATGMKLPDEIEDEIEAALGGTATPRDRRPAGSATIGDGRERYLDAPDGRGRGAARRDARRRGLRERRRVRAGPRAAAPARRRRRSRSTPSPTARTSTTAAARCTRRWSRPRSSGVGRRRRGLARRRRRPRAVRRRGGRASIDGDQVLAACAVGAASSEASSPANIGRRDGDGQHRASIMRCARPASRSCRRRSATATCWRRCCGRARCSAASSRVT